MTQPGFWDNAEAAQKLMEQKKLCTSVLEPIDRMKKAIEDAHVLVELGQDDPAAVDADLVETLARIQRDLDAAEFQLMLGGEHDRMNAIVTMQPGAGGVDANDWAEMLLRMYVKWAPKHGYQVEELDFQSAEEAGIKNATIRIVGPYAYGRLKAEQGVHRLVRISPFDGQARRQTSFASVEVVPEFEDDVEVEIRKEDLKVDTYRASGAGGQHVNKTDSAIRITHLPTGIVVECQEERSQHKNRAKAMAWLAAKLQDRQDAAAHKEISETRKLLVGSGDRSERIRTYNFPQGRVTDHRVNLTLYSLNEVIGGAVEQVIEPLLQEYQADQLAALGD